MKKPLLLDVDPGIDDALAILYALAHPAAEVRGITTVAGNVPVEFAARNARVIVEKAGRPEVPVYIGAGQPRERELVTAQDTHGENGLGEAELPEPQAPAQTGALDFIRETLKASSEPVTLLALGPLTNLAALVETDQALLEEKARIVIMGGAAKSHGNCSPVAEFNFWVDPHAAAVVFARMKNLTLVPLDVTREIVLTPDLRELAWQLGGDIGKFIHAITRFYVDFHWVQERTLGCVINDPLAVALALDPTLGRAEEHSVEIVTEGLGMGQSMVDFAKFHGREPNTRLYLETDAPRFFRSFFETLFPDAKADVAKVFAPPAPYIVRHP